MELEQNLQPTADETVDLVVEQEQADVAADVAAEEVEQVSEQVGEAAAEVVEEAAAEVVDEAVAVADEVTEVAAETAEAVAEEADAVAEVAEEAADTAIEEAEEATAEVAEEATAEVAEEATAEVAEGEGAEAADEETPIVATDDVAPAQSKIDIARIAKEALIERAQELAESTDWRKVGDEQRKLMEEWRAAGYAGKEHNDALWERFRAARDTFYTRRNEHYEQLKVEQAKVVEAKRQIIEEARAATADIQNWVSTSNLLNELMDRWKAAGNAGRENEQSLWEEFNGIRRDFRNRRKADLAERRNKERACAEAKRAIVEEAKQIAEAKSYSRESSDRMRELSEAYKQAGYAGKPANDELWQEFRTAQNDYWAGNNEARDQQRRERSERLQEAVERKSGQIEHLKDQNETLTTRLESTLNPEKVAQIKRWIAENEERLGGLKDDIDEIRKKI